MHTCNPVQTADIPKPLSLDAGALGIRLGGLNFYGGRPSQKAYLGDEQSTLAVELYPQVRRLFYATSLLMLALSLAFAAFVWRAL